jgi:hypothetical protein
MFENKVVKLAIAYLIIMFIGFIYNKYKKTIDIEEQYSDGELIQKYLLNDSSLTKNKKPILWVHIEFDKNARSWESFGSRTSDNLNQPYQYLTIRNIIEHCGESFNVCLIDDDSFIKIIPEWRTRVEHLPRPLRSHMRELALATVLHLYGGLLIPSSFICFYDLRKLYDAHLERANVMIGELRTTSSLAAEKQYSPSTKIMGCRKFDRVMKEYMDCLMGLTERDHTSEMDFTGESTTWWLKKQAEAPSTVSVIPAEELGVKTTTNKAVYLEDLLGDTDIPLSPTAAGLYIPDQEILKRSKFQWFARLSPKQVLESNTLIGKYMLVNAAGCGGGQGQDIQPLHPHKLNAPPHEHHHHGQQPILHHAQQPILHH